MFKILTRIGLAGLMAFTSLAHAAETAPESLRIGYQKGSVSMVLAKSHQLLEKRFPDTKFSWVEFPAGPQMLEALNVGSIDLGSTGDIPPIFAQAAGADLLYVGVEPPKPKAEVILVPENSDIKSVADLKGHKVAFQKGSSSHNLLLRALQEAGLKFTDIQPVYLTPADARAAFQQKNVDAWAIWDPYYSAALLQGGVRVLKDGTTLKQTACSSSGVRCSLSIFGRISVTGVLPREGKTCISSERQTSLAWSSLRSLVLFFSLSHCSATFSSVHSFWSRCSSATCSRWACGSMPCTSKRRCRYRHGGNNGRGKTADAWLFVCTEKL